MAFPVAAGAPINASDINALNAGTLAKPLVRLVQAVVQVLADNTAVAVTFTTEDIDTHGYHDNVTNNSRITPLIAGYYTVRGAVMFEALATPVFTACWIRKNGSTGLAPAARGPGSTNAQGAFTAVLVSMNGSTDYVELVAQQDSAGADNTNVSSQYTSVLELIYERPL